MRLPETLIALPVDQVLLQVVENAGEFVWLGMDRRDFQILKRRDCVDLIEFASHVRLRSRYCDVRRFTSKKKFMTTVMRGRS